LPFHLISKTRTTLRKIL